MKRIIAVVLGGLCCFWAQKTFADSLLFPYIAKSGAVTTIISIVNNDSSNSHLKLIYRFKGASANETCNSFVRTFDLSPHQMVSFDIAGHMNEGKALFSDSFGNTQFHLDTASSNRGYLLIAQVDSSGNLISGREGTLYGEAILIDISTGGAWGYKALNDPSSEDYSFTYDPAILYAAVIIVDRFCNSLGVCYEFPRIVSPGETKPFSFFPLSKWNTKFFITPVGSNMDTANLAISAFLSKVYDRDGTLLAENELSQDIKCVGALSLRDLLSPSLQSELENTGGWAELSVGGFGVGAFILKLEYSINDPSYGGTVNNAYCFSCDY